MKAERVKPKQEFVPVTVTLESQEEVDALFVVCNHAAITRTLPTLNGWYMTLTPFRSRDYAPLFNKFYDAVRVS